MDIVSKINGNTLSATEFNQMPTELEAGITASGQTPSDAILNQVPIFVSRFAANNFYIDSGVADAYVLALAASMTNPVSATVGYFVGMTICFRAGNANTGASTVNVNSAGVKNLKQADGTTDLAAGDIPTTQDSIFRYNGTSFVLQTGIASTTAKGIIEIATNAEVSAGADTQRAIVPSAFAASIYNSSNLVNSQTASNAGSIIFTGLASSYPVYEFEYINVYPSVNGVALVMQFSTDGGSTWQNTNYLSDGTVDVTSSTASESQNNARGVNLGLSDAVPNLSVSNTASLGGINGWIRIFNPASTTAYKHMKFFSTNIIYVDGTTLATALGYGVWKSTSAVNAVRFIFKTANTDTNNGFITGTIKMRGYI